MPANIDAPTLRPEEPGDRLFLLKLYASTRQEELDAAGWPETTRMAFVEMQFNAQRAGYRAAFPRAEFAIILSRGQPVGRIVVNRAEDEFRLVDIVVTPERRGQGVGTALIGNLLREARAVNKPLRLRVLKDQRALHLYMRLGFKKTGEDGLRVEMEWRPGSIS
jgi:GNAT superfamily N-acetyltransferase